MWWIFRNVLDGLLEDLSMATEALPVNAGSAFFIAHGFGKQPIPWAG